MSGLWIGGIGYALGERHAVAGLDDGRNGDTLQRLTQNGVTSYRRSLAGVDRMAEQALSQALAAWGGDPADIDLVLVCSEGFNQPDGEGGDIVRAIGRTGLSKAPIVGVTLSGCANLAPALRFARGLFSEGVRHVALVAADRCPDSRSRITDWDLAVLSDGAAACIVSPTPQNAEYRVLGLGHIADPTITALDPVAARPRILFRIATGVQRALAAARADAAADFGPLSSLLITNTRQDAMRFFASHCGLADGGVYLDGLDDAGHCFSADLLISLKRSADWRAAQGGGPFLGLSLGPAAWGALLLETV